GPLGSLGQGGAGRPTGRARHAVSAPLRGRSRRTDRRDARRDHGRGAGSPGPATGNRYGHRRVGPGVIHHLSLPATDPHHVAGVLHRLLGGVVTRFGPYPDSWIVW